MAAVDYFLKIDGIAGESLDDKHKGEIDIMSFSWGASHPATIGGAGGGGGAGRVQMQDIHFTKRIDKSSPNLFIKLASGAHLKQAILVARKGGEQAFEFLKITLTDVLVSSYQTGGSNEAVPGDQLSLNFSKIEFSFSSQNADGNLGNVLTTGWDLKANKGL